MPIKDRNKPRYDRELQSHRDIMELFAKPRCISLDDIGKKSGYSRRIVQTRLKELVGMGKLKKTTYPHEWGKPNTYETVTKGK